MSLDNASNLGTTDDIVNYIEIFIFLIKLISPLLVILILIGIIRYIKKTIDKYKTRKELIDKKKKDIEEQRNKIFKSDEEMLKRLDNISEPLDKSKYSKLDITFNTNGKAIT